MARVFTALESCFALNVGARPIATTLVIHLHEADTRGPDEEALCGAKFTVSSSQLPTPLFRQFHKLADQCNRCGDIADELRKREFNSVSENVHTPSNDSGQFHPPGAFELIEDLIKEAQREARANKEAVQNIRAFIHQAKEDGITSDTLEWLENLLPKD